MAGAFKKYYLMNAFPTQGMHENTNGIYSIGVLTSSGISNFYRLETTSLYPRVEYLIDTSQPVYADVPSVYMKVNGFIQEYILCGGKDSIQECPTVYTSRDGVKLFLFVVYFDFQYDMESYTINPDYFPYLVRDITDTFDEYVTRWMVRNFNSASSGAAFFISTINFIEPDASGNFDLTEQMLVDIMANTLNGKMSTVPTATAGNFAAFDTTGSVVDSLLNASSFATAAQGDTANQAYALVNALSDAVAQMNTDLSDAIQNEVNRALLAESNIVTQITNLRAFNIGFTSPVFSAVTNVEEALLNLMDIKANKIVGVGNAYQYDFTPISMGTGYTAGDTITFVELPGITLFVDAVDGSGTITAPRLSGNIGSTNYNGTLTPVGGTGTGVSLSVASYIARNVLSLNSFGSGYVVGDTMTVDTSSPVITVTVTGVDSLGGITSYTFSPSFTNTVQNIDNADLIGGTGTGAAIRVTSFQASNSQDLIDVQNYLLSLIAKNAADIAALQGIGGPIQATDLGATPTQQSITQYAMYAIFDDATGTQGTFTWNATTPSASTYIATSTGVTHTASEIFNGTWVRNMNADPSQSHHIWTLVNTAHTTPPVFQWIDVGTVGTNIATETVSGVVNSSSATGQVGVNPITGVMTVNGLSPLAITPFFTAGSYVDAMTIYGSNPTSLIFFT